MREDELALDPEVSDGVSDESDPLVSDSDGDDLNKDAREEIFGPDIDTLIAETQNKRRKRRKRRFPGQLQSKRRRACDIPPHLMKKMGDASMAFVSNDLDAAKVYLEELIKQAPKAASPYRTLGLIYEEKGERRKALDAYMTAANLDSRERDLWKRNAVLWEEEDDLQQAIYCLTRAIRASGGRDCDALRARAEYRLRQGQFKKAADNYAKLHVMQPNDIELIKKLTDLYKKSKMLGKAVQLLETSIEYFQQGFARRDGIITAARRGIIVRDLVHLLVEIWFQQKKYSESSSLLTRVNERFSGTGSPMTFEQRLLLAICQHRLGAETLASPTFIEFMSSPSMMEKHQILLWEVADACLDSGDYRKGARAYNLLQSSGKCEKDLHLFLRRATCYKELNDMEKCKNDLLSVLRIKPKHMEASMRLVEYFPEFARQKRAELIRKRRAKRRDKKAPAIAAALRAVEPLRPSPDIPVAERKAMISSVGYDYMTKGSEALSGASSSENILLPVSHQDVLEAFRLLECADTEFNSGNYEAFLEIIGPPIEHALNLQNKLRMAACDDLSDGEEDDVGDITQRSANVNTATNSAGVLKSSAEGRLKSKRISLRQANENTNLDNLHEVGVSLLREIDEHLFVKLLENIFHSLYHLRRMDNMEPIMTSLLSIAAVRVRPESEFKLRVQILLVLSLFATERYYDAFNKLRTMLIQSPDDPRICCLFAVAEEHMGVSAEFERFKSFRILDRLHKKHQELPVLTYINGLCSARGVNNSHNYTLGKYLQAYSDMSDSPLLCLCLVVQFAYVAQNRRVGNRNEIVLFAVAFLDEYRRKRKAHALAKCAVVVEQEMLYNAGRTMHQLGVLHMAEQLYLECLKVGESVPPWADLRRDAAYNLVHIYKKSNSVDLARDLTFRYLTF